MNALCSILFILIATNVLLFSKLGLAEVKNHDGAILHISNAWSPAATPVAPARVGYLSISNVSDKAVSIVSASSPLFTHVDFHRTVMVDGISSMESVKVVNIKAKQKLTLEPSGMHLMLMHATPDLAKATSIPLMLNLDNGQTLHVDLAIKDKRTTEKSAMKHAHHAHH